MKPNRSLSQDDFIGKQLCGCCTDAPYRKGKSIFTSRLNGELIKTEIPKVKRPSKLRRANSKDLDKLYDKVMSLIKEGLSQGIVGDKNRPASIPGYSPYFYKRISKEGLAHTLKVPEHQIAVVLAKMNTLGFVSQKSNNAPHDTKRDFWGGSLSAWMPSYYTLNLEKLNDHFSKTPSPRLHG